MSSLRILKSNPRNPPETVTWRPTDSAVSFGAQSAGVSYDLHIILYKYIPVQHSICPGGKNHHYVFETCIWLS